MSTETDEKAKELLDKYRTYVVMWSGGVEIGNENVKQCALIAASECEKCCDNDYVDPYANQLSAKEFWKEVAEKIKHYE